MTAPTEKSGPADLAEMIYMQSDPKSRPLTGSPGWSEIFAACFGWKLPSKDSTFPTRQPLTQTDIPTPTVVYEKE